MLQQTLPQLTEQIVKTHAGSASYVVPTEQISLTDSGHLRTGKNEFPVRREASEQFARLLEIPGPFFLGVDPDIRVLLFNRRFKPFAAAAGMDRNIRIHVDENKQVVGYDDPRLLRISPPKLMESIVSALPPGLPAEQIGVAAFDFAPERLHVSLVVHDSCTCG